MAHGTPHVETGKTIAEVVDKLTPEIRRVKTMYGARQWNKDLRIFTISEELPDGETMMIVDSVNINGTT